MLDWFLSFAQEWLGVQQATAHVIAQVTITAIATLDTAGRLAKDQFWYIAHPYIKAGPALVRAGMVRVVQSAPIAQEPASVTLSASVVRGIESVLTRTEANASLVDWAVTRTTSGAAGASSGVPGVQSSVEDIEALNLLLGVHL